MFGYTGADVTDTLYWQSLAVMVNRFCGFDRGDINDDGEKNLADVVALWSMVNSSGPGPLFKHLADVNDDGSVDNADIAYLADFYFCFGPPPAGDWTFPDIYP